MAKRLTVEESKQKVIDYINGLHDAENANIEKYMDRYASLRALEGEAREEAYKDIAFAIFGDYRETEAPDQAEDEEPEEILQAEEVEPEEILQAEEVEPQLETEVEPQMREEAPELRAREKLENVAFSVVLPPKAEIVPLVSPEAATKSLLERLLSFWDGTTATIETAWEMYLYPVVMVLLSLLGAVWAVSKTVASLLWMGGKMAYRGARAALPVMGASIIRAWGVMAVAALLGAKLAIWGAHAGIRAASFGADLATTAAGQIRAGWQMREDLINEWREAA